MTSILTKVTYPRITQALSHLFEHLRTPLYANAYALIMNQIVSAGLGVLYWLAAARLYSVEVVGQNSATISTLVFLAALAEFSLKSAMVRFVPRMGARTARLILYTYCLSLVAAALVSFTFFVAGNRFSFTTGLLKDIPIGTGWLIVATMTWCIFYIQDGVLIGMRQAVWVLVENSLYNISKIVLLIAGAWVFYDYGIAASWFLPTPLLVLLVNGLIFWRFMSGHVTATNNQTQSITPRQVITSITGDHIGTLLAEVGVKLLPLFVLNVLGKSANAYFYQSWMIATLLYLIASNMTSSFTVEAAANLSHMTRYSRQILYHMARLIVPMAVVMFIGAPLGLSLFGEAYAREGTTLLRWLALAALPIMFNHWYLNYARVLGHVKSVILAQGLVSLLTLGLSYWWLPTLGITGIGVAWFISQTLLAVLAAVKTAPMLLSRGMPNKNSQQITRNQLWRRADWRFLSAIPYPSKSVCFADGLLAKSVATISKLMVDGQSTQDHDCDLAVAVNPDQITLQAAYACLRSGGVCYTEWIPWQVGGGWGIRRRLQAAGFTHVQLYWPYPTPAAARLWLPLQSHQAPYHYLANRLLAGNSLVRRVVRTILVGMLPFGVQWGLVPHLCGIAYKGTSLTQDVFEFTRAEWSRRRPDRSADRLSFLVQTSGLQLYNKVIYLVFAQANSHPQWIIKLPRATEDTRTLRCEQDILAGLSHSCPTTAPAIMLPSILFSRELNEVWVSGQTALVGTPLNAMVQHDNVRELALQLTDYQVALARQSLARPRIIESRQIVERLITSLDGGAGQVVESQVLTQTRSILAALAPVPLVCIHNDFTPWNVVLTKDGLGVFDWVDAAWDGLPMLDLVYALSTLAFTLEDAWDGPRMAATYAMLLDPRTAMGAIFQECLERYASQIGLLPHQIAPLRLLTWVLHSNFEYQNLKEEHGGQILPGQPHGSLCVPLWKMELQLQFDHRLAGVTG